jgi:hypothetical protein
MTKPQGRPVALRLESLEPRLVPSGVTESFDTTAPGTLPAGWSQWSSTGGAAFAVSDTLADSAPNGLTVTSNQESLAARAWLDAAAPADVQVQADVFLGTLIPAQVFARGTNLDTAAASYYAHSVTRGLEVELLRVAGGTVTTLGEVQTTDYVSQLWVSATLHVNGDNLRARLYRPDTGLYLNAAGLWQPDPAWALNLRDSAITAGGRVGLGRPASHAGTVTFDDFSWADVTAESMPPAVTVTAPADGATVSGVVNVRATATDNVGVARVEFYMDGVLRSVDAAGPYAWDFDTTAVANGGHVLTVLAYDSADNVGRASLSVTASNDTSLPAPVIPRHYSHIRVAQLAYGGNPMGDFEDDLLRESVDLVVANPSYLQHIDGVSPDTPQLIYTNVSNLYLDLLTDWLAWADANGKAREGAFYHVVAATPFSGTSPSSQPVNWFWGVYRGGTTLTNLTGQARGTAAGGVTFGAAGESVYVGYTDRFREINVDLSGPAAGGWSGVLEYAAAVDAAGNPTAWAALPLRGDGTAGLTRSGRITFDPPAVVRKRT